MVVSGHHIHALWWGPQASRKRSSRADIYDEKAMPGREPLGVWLPARRSFGLGRRWATFSGPGGVLDGMATVGATSRTYLCAHGGLKGLAPSVSPAGLVRTDRKSTRLNS